MKKLLSVLAVTAALAIALGGTLVVSAQGRGGGGCWACPGGTAVGPGGWTDRGVPGGGILDGAQDTYLADALGMTVEEFQTARESGLTFYQIALEQGFEPADLPAIMQQARDAALADAVDAGTITQDQADWMAQRGAGRFGSRGGRFGGRGGSFGGYLGECPYGYEPGSMGRWNGANVS
ncbi:MAG: hypothetical protein GXX93_06330 [Anaerolineae bacterium]|nr:hypothetical protein [Anaerolineae bacterium]